MSKLKATTGTNGRGQQNLFSFFKKPAASTTAAALEVAAKGQLVDSPLSAVETPQKALSSPVQMKNSAQIVNSPAGNTLVDKRIEVFWPKDNEWYAGTVGMYNPSNGSHTVAYDDGIVEVLNLDEEKYHMLDEMQAKKRKLPPEDDESDGEVIRPNKRSLVQKKAVRRVGMYILFETCKIQAYIVIKMHLNSVDEDDDEGEWNAAAGSGSETDEASWMSSSDDDAFSADEDEEEEVSKKKKKTINSNAGSSNPRVNVSVVPPKTPSTNKVGVSAICNNTGNTSVASYTPNQSQTKSTSFSPIGNFNGTEDSGKKESSPAFILPEGVSALGSHEHDLWPFYINLKDKNGVSVGSPGYNPRTWQVPTAILKAQTPGMKQWFEFKTENFDLVLFFKIGKFYELYHMDADIGFKELDLIFMKGSKAHSGFPEVSFGKYASILVAKGYKVARVEQTETPDMLKERNKSAGKGESSKVVARELCSIMSLGTRTYCHLDDVTLMTSGSQESLSGPSSSLLCIKESPIARKGDDMEVVHEDDVAVVEYGICYVDTVLGSVTLSQFQDDRQRSRLRTMLSCMPPSEVLLEKQQSGTASYSAETIGAIRLANPKVLLEYLAAGPEFPVSSSTVLNNLKAGQYFSSRKESGSNDDIAVYPTVLKAVIRGLEDSSSLFVALAIGGALWYLKRALIDYEVLSLGKFNAYIPPDTHTGNRPGSALLSDCGDLSGVADALAEDTIQSGDQPKHMVLDAVALANLEILQNNFDKTEKGSLWAFINKCKTTFGRRLLKSWLVKPLFGIEDIQSRGSAVEELMTNFAAEAEMARKALKNVPDLERLLSRVHTNGSKERFLNHPDSRAQMYEGSIYNGRKIRDFVDLIGGLETLLRLEEIFGAVELESPYLRNVVKSTTCGGKFPFADMKIILKYFREIFDENQAKRDGTIKPRPGLNEEYDKALSDSKDIEKNLDNYLKEQRKATGISELSYWGTGKDRFQIEVPMAQASKVPNKWVTKSQKKTHRRYRTPFVETALAELMMAEDRVAMAEKDTMRSIFEKFDKERNIWSVAVLCTSILDALLSLALVSSTPGYVWPTFTRRNDTTLLQPFLRVKAGRHAMLEQSLVEKGSGDYIPNDLSLGGTQSSLHSSVFTQLSPSDDDSLIPSPNVLLLSGPNMGGKSTLLRQTCLLCVLAQLGCRVPAAEFSLSPVDRIFTRVGASDRILSGQSTFFVELAETALILKSATADSLCILDELGRGTSTFDGTAIAHSVVDHLVGKVRCRTLFATHYHSLADDWAVDPRVKLGHMDCLVQSLNGDKLDDESDKVTFLYHLCDGSSPKSYGVNVARLAGLPAEVLALAVQQSDEFLSRSTFDAEADCANGLARKNAFVIRQRYFDTLVSLVSSTMSDSELLAVTAELWRRCNHDLSLLAA